MFNRIIKLPQNKSFFLFGARSTGKSTLLRNIFAQGQSSIWFDLLDLDIEARFSARPQALFEELQSHERNKQLKWVVIDEIQKIPQLLDIVHAAIERKRFLFALSGSSSRKLKRGRANLLAGRAFTRNLYPLTHLELGDRFQLNDVLLWGSLPPVFELRDSDRIDFLRTYANTYLKEEIQAEQIVRKIPPFRAFLEVAAQSAGKIVSFSRIARDVSSDPVSVQSYFQILEDTHIGFLLQPYHRSVRKRQRSNPKFYYFDLGVQRALSRTVGLPMSAQTSIYGEAFEQFIILEILRIQDYMQLDWKLSYLRTKDDAEIDLIIERPGMPIALIEIKSTSRLTPDHVAGLKRFLPDFKKREAFCLSQDPVSRKIDGIHCLPWMQGLRELGLS